jgi:hypothetical protein
VVLEQGAAGGFDWGGLARGSGIKFHTTTRKNHVHRRKRKEKNIHVHS